MNHSITIGYALCGSFCTFAKSMETLKALAAEYEHIIPIFSAASYTTDTRFGTAQHFIEQAEQICGHEVLSTLKQVEPFGPKKLLDLLVICPCTGNTLGKLANGIADSSVTLACKAHLRNERPVVVAVSTNDGLGANAESIGKLLARKNFYFVPFGQDDAIGKPTSLVADFRQVPQTVKAALQAEQIQPMLLRS